jgi:uroporphyrinogen-III synthase
VLVTRPADRAHALCAAVAAQGGEAIAVPLLEIQPLPLDPPLRALFARLGEFDLAVFVSANAVTLSFARVAEAGAQWPGGLGCVAVGAATRAALERAGARIAAAGRAAMNSEELLARAPLATPRGLRILLLRGEGGRGLLAQTLRERGATVQECALYRRVLPAAAVGGLAAALQGRGVDALLVSSGETLQNLLGLLRGMPAGTIPAHALLVVPGARVAAIATERGGFETVVADNAADTAMLAALAQAAGRLRDRT